MIIKYLLDHYTVNGILVSFGIIILIIISMIYVLHSLKIHRDSLTGKNRKIVDIHEKSDKVAAHIIAYFFFMVIDIDSIGNIVGIVLMFILIGMIFTKSGLVLSNPFLLVLGYKVYEIESVNVDKDNSSNSGHKKTVISTKLLSKNQVVTIIKISSDVNLIKG